MTMRFGGHIAALAFVVVFAGGAAGQSPDQAQAQAPAAAQQPAAQEGTQSQIDNPASNADAVQQKQKAVNPTDKSNPLERHTPTAEEEYEQKVKQYDPLAPQSQPPQPDSSSKQANEKSDTSASTDAAPQPSGIGSPGPAVAESADTANSAESNGPAVLSRTYTLMRPMSPSQQYWAPFVGVDGIYDSGLYGVEVNNNGQLQPASTVGAQVFWGISGRHYSHRNIIGLNYRGDATYYSQGRQFDGSNEWADFDFTHMFSPRISLTLVESGSMFSQSFGLENPAAVSDGSVSAVNVSTTPNVQFIDTGYKQFTSGADVTYQKTARLSFDAGGSWFTIGRNTPYLIGSTGSEGRADGMYRLNKRMTAGGSFSYDEYAFPHGLGSTSIYSINGVYSWAISPSVELHLRGGGSHVSSMGLASYNLAPSLAQLVGQNTITVEYKSASWISSFSAGLSKNFRHNRSASVSYSRGIIPGNGFYLTSVDQSMVANASFILKRRYLASIGNGYDSMSAVAQTIGSYRSYYAYVGVSRELMRGLQSNLRFDYRHYVLSGSPLLANEYRITVGFSWHPPEALFRFW